MRKPAAKVYEFGAFRINTVRRLLLRDGEIVVLTPKTFDTLLALVENTDRVLEKDELLRIIWPDTVVEERNLTVNISTLRKALGEAATEHRYIVTVPGRGYRFAAAVREAQDESDDLTMERHPKSVGRIERNARFETDPARPSLILEGTARLARQKKAILLVVVITAVALAGGLAIYFKRANREQREKLNQAGAPIPIRSIAVLPFKPLVADSRDESLEMGMADTLITRLSNSRQMIVRSMGAVRRYAGLEQDPVAAAREQGVDAVLDGSLQKSGERVRVTVRLISAANGQQLWDDKFDEKFTDIFSVQDSISERVAGALAVKLTGEEQKQLTKRYTKNTDAYQFYLQGRYYASKYNTPEGIDRGIEYFNKAIAIDPNYALAYDGLAYIYYATDWNQLPREAGAKGRALAKKALEIDPTLAEAHTSLGVIYAWFDYDWPAAEREFKRAYELNPNYAYAHLWYGFLLTAFGRGDESIAETKRAIELDPLSPEANTSLGIFLFYAHRYDEAIQQLRTTIDLLPDYWFAHLYLARAFEKKGDFSAAIAELERTKIMEGAAPEVLSALGYAYAASGKRVEAQRIIGQLKEKSKRTYVWPYNIAVIYAGLGEKDQAFAYLDKEYAEGNYYLDLLKVDPELDSLRSDPRFADLLRRVGLVP
jgi:DNA-binding winged helix-turn-helix (wHTH) protein/TolB-like protein/Flp pilus assembly protein TadD